MASLLRCKKFSIEGISTNTSKISFPHHDGASDFDNLMQVLNRQSRYRNVLEFKILLMCAGLRLI